jgi:hypothetical protein
MLQTASGLQPFPLLRGKSGRDAGIGELDETDIAWLC